MVIVNLPSTIVYNDKNLTDVEKNNIFAVIFYTKYIYYYVETYSFYKTGGFNDCMEDQLNDVFGNDNYVDDIGYIVGCPISVLWTVGYCIFD